MRTGTELRERMLLDRCGPQVLKSVPHTAVADLVYPERSVEVKISRTVSLLVLVAALAGSILAIAGHAGAEKMSLGAKTIAPPSPVWLICSYDAAGKPNMMTASWVGIVCSKPPCVAVSLREATYTFGNIKAHEAYTVNIPSEKLAAVSAYAGVVSGRDIDKFTATGLTAVKSDLVDAPYIEECELVLECRLVKTVELGLHTMFIGEIIDVKADEAILGENDSPDPEKHKPFIWSVGGYGFYGLGGHIGGVGELAKKYME
jgi:flavin reductase (DIM6/NTAB) family NADH-FMN oxidoreductase RutF